MPDPLSTSNVGTPKCPHCMTPARLAQTPLANLKLYQCPECQKTYVIIAHAFEYTTFPTNIDPSDITEA